jgi:cation diffusion facilitator family transporter
MADALTSVLAIIALLAAKYFGYIWMDPVMGIVGAVLVARWSYGLLGSTSGVLLDRQAPEVLQQEIRGILEADEDTRVTDLHVWSIGPGIYSAQIALVGHKPLSALEYKALIPETLRLVHVSVEVHVCPDHDEAGNEF